MQVIDCVGPRFVQDCRQLAKLALADYKPDLIVGIHQGGAEVAATMHKENPVLATKAHVDLVSSRPSTRLKRLVQLKLLLRWLPKPVCNQLRRWEMQRNIDRFDPGHFVSRDISISPAALEKLEKAKAILLIDDAVDSGITLHSVVAYIRRHNPGAKVRTAVLTVTFPEPLVMPDYCVYRGDLLRFPWSADA